MELNIKLLVSKLKHHNPQLHLFLGEHITVKGIRLLSGELTAYDPDILYFVNVTDLLKILPLNCCTNIICVEDCSLPLENIDHSKLNLIIIDKSIKLIDIFGEVQDILFSHKKLVTSSAKLLNALVEDNGIQYIIDIASELLINPIHVSDLSHKILAHTKNFKIDDPIWNTIVNAGHTPFSIVSQHNRAIFERVRNDTSPVIHFEPNSKIYLLQIRISANNKAIGYITIPGYIKPFGEDDMEIASLLSKVLSLELQKNKFFHNSKGLMYEYFITDLLDGKIRDASTIEDKLKYIDLQLKENIYVITIRSKQYVKESPSLTYIKESINSLVNFGKSVIYDEDIVLVISCNTKVLIPESNLKTLMEMLRKNNLIGGISRCFNSLIDLGQHYKESLNALELGTLIDKHKTFYTYEDYAVYHFMNVRGELENSIQFCHPALFVLVDYDQKHSTNFVTSLYVYLNNDKNIVKSAKILHVHRNTMSYRMDKIAEVMNLDINNKDISFHLLLSFKLLIFNEVTNLKKQIPQDTSNPIDCNLWLNLDRASLEYTINEKEDEI